MTQIERILLPTDFSELAERAAGIAQSLALRNGSVLHVIHVINPVSYVSAGMGPEAIMLLPPKEQLLREGLELVDAFVREHLPIVPTDAVVSLVAVGSPISTITKYAHQQDIDLIVIGTHACGITRRLLHGSISKCILEHAPCPVLMVPLTNVAAKEAASKARDLWGPAALN